VGPPFARAEPQEVHGPLGFGDALGDFGQQVFELSVFSVTHVVGDDLD
jgi:hypothetical protein